MTFSLCFLAGLWPVLVRRRSLRGLSGVAADRATDDAGGVCYIAVRIPGDKLIGPDQYERRLVKFPRFRGVVLDQLQWYADGLGGAPDLGGRGIRRAEIEQRKPFAQFLEDIVARRKLARRQMMAGACRELMRPDRTAGGARRACDDRGALVIRLERIHFRTRTGRARLPFGFERILVGRGIEFAQEFPVAFD